MNQKKFGITNGGGSSLTERSVAQTVNSTLGLLDAESVSAVELNRLSSGVGHATLAKKSYRLLNSCVTGAFTGKQMAKQTRGGADGAFALLSVGKIWRSGPRVIPMTHWKGREDAATLEI